MEKPVILLRLVSKFYTITPAGHLDIQDYIGCQLCGGIPAFFVVAYATDRPTFDVCYHCTGPGLMTKLAQVVENFYEIREKRLNRE